MIGTKAIVAVALTSLGGLTSGTAAYLEGHPGAFNRASMGQSSELLQPAPIPLRERSPVLEDESSSDVLVLAPVMITSRPRHGHRAVTTSVKTERTSAPCSEWQDLATGPAGRQVRLICPP